MRPYQEKYIENCERIRALNAALFSGAEEDFASAFDRAMADVQETRELMGQNTGLLQNELLPLLDDLYLKDEDELVSLEEFADALTRGPVSLDVALACQIHEALLSCARRRGRRETVIRELYKLGMARYGLCNMINGLEIPEIAGYSSRMRYCFVEAASYLQFFAEVEDEDTKGYILRSLGNTYLGTYEDWRKKLDCVRSTMRVFQDERYRTLAPGLPWDLYMRLVHRQMSGVLPYSLTGGSLAPNDVADVMESAHLVYEKQFEDVRHEGYSIEAHNLLPYYAIEYSCGLITREQLLAALEELMDPADPAKYDPTNIYLIVSLPSYYAHYLALMPELMEPRRAYLAQLYERMVQYVRAMPAEVINDGIRTYVRQVMHAFVELEGGITFREVLLLFMARFTPRLYAHSHAVAEIALTICRAILDGEPGFFDELPEVQAASSPEEKRAAVLELAESAGLLHDVGMMHLGTLYDQQCRQMLCSEEEIMQLHTDAGWQRLKVYASTKGCADAALGHHRWYDGSDGYPEGYRRLDSPYRALVDVLCVADFLDRDSDTDMGVLGSADSFAERLEEVFRLGGRRFSPMVVSWLRDPALCAEVRERCASGRREGYYRCFRRLTEDGSAALRKRR